MTLADECVARHAAALDRLDEVEVISDADKTLPECAHIALALSRAVRPMYAITIKLAARSPLGVDVEADASWAAVVALARREVTAQRAAGVDQGLASDSLRLLEWVDAQLGDWPADGWTEAVDGCVGKLVDARQQGARRGRELRGRRPGSDSDRWTPTVGWLLRHPSDHWLQYAIRGLSDSRGVAPIEGLVAKLAVSYDQMRMLDFAVEEAAAEVVCEIEIEDNGLGGWKKPSSAVITAVVNGDYRSGQSIEIWLVEDPDAPFNGTLVNWLAGERWRVCARRFNDRTLLPLDGCRRLAPTAS